MTTIAELARRHGLKKHTLAKRLRSGWPLDVALSKPVEPQMSRQTRQSMSHADLAARHYARHSEPDKCWEWGGATDRAGYGFIMIRRKHYRAHRLVYEAEHGPIPGGLVLDHFYCSNRRCVRPSHLRPVSIRENVLRSDCPGARNAAKTHCIRGHAFSGENVSRNRHGHRICRKCRQLKRIEYRMRREARPVPVTDAKGRRVKG